MSSHHFPRIAQETPDSKGCLQTVCWHLSLLSLAAHGNPKAAVHVDLACFVIQRFFWKNAKGCCIACCLACCYGGMFRQHHKPWKDMISLGSSLWLCDFAGTFLWRASSGCLGAALASQLWRSGLILNGFRNGALWPYGIDPFGLASLGSSEKAQVAVRFPRHEPKCWRLGSWPSWQRSWATRMFHLTMLSSYRPVGMKILRWQMQMHGVLNHYDLPDLLAARRWVLTLLTMRSIPVLGQFPCCKWSDIIGSAEKGALICEEIATAGFFFHIFIFSTSFCIFCRFQAIPAKSAAPTLIVEPRGASRASLLGHLGRYWEVTGGDRRCSVFVDFTGWMGWGWGCTTRWP